MTESPSFQIPKVASDRSDSFPAECRKPVLVSAILASSMGFIDGTIVSLAMPAIRADLGASLADAQWINNAYMLFLSALVLSGGAAGDVFGVRRVFGAGVAIFVATSLLCALAWDPVSLIILRGAQGIGAALMVPGSLAMIAKTHPPDIRGQAIGTWAAVSAVTTALGPIVGSFILSVGDNWMWRFLFAINVPFGLIVLAYLFWRIPKIGTVSGRRLDIGGAILATVSLGALAWGLTAYGLEGGVRLVDPWVWIGAGILLAVVFLIWERRSEQPMVSLQLFSSAAFSGANFYTLILFLAFNAVLFFLPMVLITAWDVIEWKASMMFAPLSMFIGLFSRRAGAFADRYGPRWPLTIGALVVAVAYLLLGMTMDLYDLWTTTFPIMCLAGLGMAMLVSPLSTAIMLAVDDDDAGVASGVNNAIARSAGLLAVAAFGAVAAISFAQIVPEPSDLAFGSFIPDGTGAELAETHREGSNHAFRIISFICAGLCLFAALIAAWSQPAWKKVD